MMNELSTDKLTIDPESGQRFVYVGGNWNQYGITPDSVVCYSPTEVNGLRAVLLADGSVQSMNAERFAEASLHGFIKPLSPGQIAQNQQAFAVQHAQFQTPQPGGAMANANGAASGANPAPAIIGGGPAPITGAHSIRIEIPRAGQAFVFTKVLNIGRERLSVRAHLMRWQTFRTAQMLMQLTGFLAGLVLWYWAWRNSRNSLLLTFGIALIAGSVGSLLLAWRLLHAGLILLAPAVALGVLGWLLWKYWPRSASAPAPLRVSPGFEPGIPPAVATIA
jgi:hypothetical protein